MQLTEEGFDAVEEVLGVNDLYDPRDQWATYILNAIRAKELQVKDVNYIVSKDEIVIVDEFTGTPSRSVACTPFGCAGCT